MCFKIRLLLYIRIPICIFSHKTEKYLYKPVAIFANYIKENIDTVFFNFLNAG
jgi:hypothetical protein